MIDFNFSKEIEIWKNKNPFWENEDLGNHALFRLDKIHKEFIKRLIEGLMIDPDKMKEFEELVGEDLI